jgi:hypothetical protein
MRRLTLILLLLPALAHAQYFGGYLSKTGGTITGSLGVTGSVNVQGTLSSTSNLQPAGLTNSGVSLGGGPNYALVQLFDSAQSANNKTSELISLSGAMQLRFKNDAGNNATAWLSASGGYASGITGITSSSGSGSWVHTGGFSATTLTGSGSNNITLTGATSGNSPTISTAGGNPDVGLTINTKGAGGIVVNATTTFSNDVAVSGSIVAGSGTIRVYSAAGVQITTPHIVTGTVTLASGNGTATFTGNAVFSNTTSYVCTATNTSTNSAVRATNASASSVTFNSGTTNDVISYQCTGN